MQLDEFTVPEAADRPSYHCSFHNIMTAISPRHSDTVDVNFLVNGKHVVVGLAHAGFAQFRKTGKPLSDLDAIRMAGSFLKNLLEQGEWVGAPVLPVSIEQTVDLARKVTRGSPS